MNTLAKVLLGDIRSQLLAITILHPDQAYYVRELERLTGKSVGALHRELGALVRVGILTRKQSGNQVHYQASLSCPIFQDLSAILRKTLGMGDVLRGALAVLRDRIVVAAVFGSMARGDARAGSDVDLLVVGDATFSEVVLALAPAQEKLQREVNPVVLTMASFRDRLLSSDPFLQRVMRDPMIFLEGSNDDLGQPAEGR